MDMSEPIRPSDKDLVVGTSTIGISYSADGPPALIELVQAR